MNKDLFEITIINEGGEISIKILDHLTMTKVDLESERLYAGNGVENSIADMAKKLSMELRERYRESISK